MTSSAPVTGSALHAGAPRRLRWPRWIADRAPVLVIRAGADRRLVRRGGPDEHDAGARRLRAQRDHLHASGPHRRHARCRASAGGGAAPDLCCSSSTSCSAIRRIPRAASLYHSWVTLSATFVGFALGAAFGILLAVLIVHVRTLEKSLLPWIICSQMVPILAVAPIIIVVLGSIGLRGLLPKSLISAYLCFFPVTIGMVKGLTSPDPIQRDLMRTWSATPLAGVVEAALAVLGAVPVREPQGRHHHLADRRHRRGTADRRAGRHRRAPAGRLLLRPDRCRSGPRCSPPPCSPRCSSASSAGPSAGRCAAWGRSRERARGSCSLVAALLVLARPGAADRRDAAAGLAAATLLLAATLTAARCSPAPWRRLGP